MKKILLIIALSFTVLVTAQIPQGISYQAIALNGTSAVVSSNVGVRLSILNTSATGTVLYTETQTKMTNAQGLFNLIIGQGTPTVGTFATINWTSGSKFLKVEMDIAGGTNYALVGTTQLLSVPYAMTAGSLAASATGNSLADDIREKSYVNYAFADYNGNKMYVYNARTGTWSNQSFNPNGSPDLVNSYGNFAFMDYYDNKAYAFSASTGTWSSQTFNGNGSPDLVVSATNFAFMDYNDNKAYIFNSKTASWVSQTFNGNGSPTLIGSNGGFAFMDYNDNKAYVYNSNTGSWIAQAFNGNGSPDFMSTNDSVGFVDYNDSKVYVFNRITNTWIAQSFDPNGSPTLITSPN